MLTVDRGTDRLAVNVYDIDDAETIAVIMPAMGTPAGFYRRFAESLNAAGIAVAVADLRGVGASKPRPGRSSRYGYDELIDDVGAVLDALIEQRAGRRTILLGHSLGGQLAAAHLARSKRGDVDGLVLIAVGLPYYRLYGWQTYGVFGFTQLIGLTASMLGVWPGWNFGGRQAQGVMRDWAHTGRHGKFPPHLAVEEQLPEVAIPILAISVDDDQYTPPSTLDHLVAKMPAAPATRFHFGTSEAGIPLDHFKWTRAGAALAPQITAWLTAEVSTH